MDYSKLSTATLKKLKAGEPLDYATMETEELVEIRKAATASAKPKPSALESVGRGALQGASLGFSDEITGGVEALLTDKTYEQARDESRANNERAQAANPKSYLAGDVGASIATGFIPGLNVAKAATLGARVGKAAKLGAASGLGYSDAKDIQGAAIDTASGAALGSAFQGVGEKVVSPILSKVTDGDWLAKKFGKGFANVPEDVTEKYLANPGKYAEDKIKPLEKIKDDIDLNSRTLKDGKESAEAALRNLELERSGEIMSQRETMSDILAKLRGKASEANAVFRSEATDLVNDLKSKKPSLETVDAIQDMKQNLSTQLSADSTLSFDILGADNVKVGKNKLLSILGQSAKELEVAGKAPIGGRARKAYNAILSQIDNASELPDQIDGKDAKKIIMQLDADIDWESINNKGKKSLAEVAQTNARTSLDGELKKQSTNYDEQMKITARKAETLSDVQKKFGSDERTYNQIIALANDNSQYAKESLQKLAKETGFDIEEMLEEYLQSQAVLRDPNKLRKVKESLDSFKDAQWQANLLDAVDLPAATRAKKAASIVDEAGGFGQRQQQATQQLEQATEAYKRDYVGDSEPLIKRFLSGRADVDDNRLMDRLGPVKDDVENLRVYNSFEKGDTNGSRRTMLGSVVGKAVGAGLGATFGYATGGDAGAAVGATAGFGADRYAGKVFKTLLNGKISADKQIETINQMAPQLGRFANTLSEAAKRGNQSLAATHFVLSQRDPEYRKTIQDIETQDDDK